MKLYRDLLRMLGTQMKASPAISTLTVAVTLVRGVLPAAEVITFKGLIDTIIGKMGWGPVLWWLGGLTAVVALQELIKRLVPALQLRLAHDASRLMMERLLAKAGRMPLLAFESPAYYDRFTRARKGVQDDMGGVMDAVLWLGRGAIATVSTLAAMAALNPGAALLLMLAGGPAWVLQARAGTRFYRLFRSQVPRRRYAQYLGDLLRKRAFAQEVRLFGLAGEVIGRWRSLTGQMAAERRQMAVRNGATQLATTSVGDLAFAGSLGVMGLAALGGSLTVGGFAAAIRAAQDLEFNVQSLTIYAGTLQQAGLFIGEVWAFLDDPAGGEVGLEPAGRVDEPAGGPVAGATEGAGAVRCEGVSFGYPGGKGLVLENVTFDVLPGELIALVGENGAGKSTLVKLLLGLYPPTAGELLVDGVAVGAGEGAAVRARIAPVFQDYLKYSLTAGENIGVGDAAAMEDRERVVRAAQGSGAAAVVTALPKSYETQLGREFEDGVELSGGQWQKLAIGRAYMRDAAILILDEPTAALDPLAELEVFRHFGDLARGRTAFFISHRLGAARLADRVLVLKQGRLVEQGSHEELLAWEGEYAALFRTQAEWYKEAAPA
jgi:ATP-binding cassette subfamily B protein